MQSIGGRDGASMRRARVACPRCGERVELARMRVHLREAHQIGSADLDASFLSARRAAQRGTRPTRR
jgi:hypothetical protein